MTLHKPAALALALVAIVTGAGHARAAETAPVAVSSPSGEVALTFTLEDGAPRYAVTRGGREVVRPHAWASGSRTRQPSRADSGSPTRSAAAST